jgi:hypothetical protein
VTRVLSFALAILLVGCISLTHQSDGPVKWDTVAVGIGSITDSERTAVVRDPAMWRHVLSERFSHKLPPSVSENLDFRKTMIIAMFTGARSNGCYAVRIDDVRREKGRIIVEYSEKIPGFRSICTYSVVHPYHMISLPNSPDPVDFVRRADKLSSW